MDNIFSQYTNALCKEIEFVSEKYKNGLVDTIFFGGERHQFSPPKTYQKYVIQFKKISYF